MDRTVYFADKAVLFTAHDPSGAYHAVAADMSGAVSRDKVLKILETHNPVALVSADPERAFGTFAAGFTQVEAAGGVVVNEGGEWLMIRRNGRWDLPKGHVECGEDTPACAAREIGEETGVCAEVGRPLCDTWHAYWFPRTARWELKHTHWYLLRATGCHTLAPQTEEGIEEVAWCSPERVEENLRGSFPTIRCVAAAMKNRK
ncbi:NUDIX hydrolase [Alistipes sp.]|uniref:NUDIX hydrolase n=1 Tax=Alistipes sp. TaxID=1872444 RepID=UPI003AF1C44E